MRLFQPTNITPDTRGALGNGVVHNADGYGLPVSWQVNGNTAMTAFRIDVYDNDQASTLLVTTGKIATGCPFYGSDAMGNPVLFTYTIPAVDCASLLDSNDPYKLKITQWWGTDPDDYVAQQSPSVFYVYESVIYDVTDAATNQPLDGETLTTRSVSAVGSMDRNLGGGGSDVGILWFRWVLENATNPNAPYVVSDTGKVYGGARMLFSYDGLFSGETYKLYLSFETDAGELFENIGPDTFDVSYSVESTGIDLVAARDCGGESAVRLTWPRLVSIPATTVGMVGYGADNVVLKDAASLTWNTENNDSMSIGPEWAVIWKGTLNGQNGSVVRLDFDDSTYAFIGYIPQNGGPEGHLYWSYLGYSVGNVFFTVDDGSQAMLILTKDQIICKHNGNDGLYPDNDLYPLNSLFPSDGINGYYTHSRPVDYATTPFADRTIVSVSINGPQTLDYLQIIGHTPSQNEIQNYLDFDFSPGFDFGTRFLLDSGSLDGNAGSLVGDSDDYDDIKIYRQTAGEEELVPVAALDKSDFSILDYGAKSQQGPYTYYLFLDANDTPAVQARAVSNTVNPCFWNWNLLFCTQRSDGTYRVRRSFLFGLNLASGSISNNNKPNVLNNFTRYPLVQIAPFNYKSGTLQSLIGSVNYDCEGTDYSDTTELRDAIMDLSSSKDFLFLKNRKGDLWKVRPGGEIDMETADNTREQAQTVSFPWVETGSAEGAAIYRVTDGEDPEDLAVS